MKLEEKTPVVTITFAPQAALLGLSECTRCGRDTYIMVKLDDTRCCRWCFRQARRAAASHPPAFARA